MVTLPYWQSLAPDDDTLAYKLAIADEIVMRGDDLSGQCALAELLEAARAYAMEGHTA